VNIGTTFVLFFKTIDYSIFGLNANITVIYSTKAYLYSLKKLSLALVPIQQAAFPESQAANLHA